MAGHTTWVRSGDDACEGLYPDTKRYEYVYYLYPFNELVIYIIKEDDHQIRIAG